MTATVGFAAAVAAVGPVDVAGVQSRAQTNVVHTVQVAVEAAAAEAGGDAAAEVVDADVLPIHRAKYLESRQRASRSLRKRSR